MPLDGERKRFSKTEKIDPLQSFGENLLLNFVVRPKRALKIGAKGAFKLCLCTQEVCVWSVVGWMCAVCVWFLVCAGGGLFCGCICD